MTRIFVTAALCAALLGACAEPKTDVTVTGEFALAEAKTLPPGTVAHIRVSDISGIDEPPTELVMQDVPAPSLPITFSITVPADKIPENPHLSVSARVDDGLQDLYITEDKNPVIIGTPVQVTLVGVKPAAIPYVCGKETFAVAFNIEGAEIESPRAMTLPVKEAEAGAPANQVVYSDGKMTFTREGDKIMFARGKAAPESCAKAV